jgi:hypothetical protein
MIAMPIPVTAHWKNIVPAYVLVMQVAASGGNHQRFFSDWQRKFSWKKDAWFYPSSRHEALLFSYLLDDRRTPSNVNLTQTTNDGGNEWNGCNHASWIDSW